MDQAHKEFSLTWGSLPIIVDANIKQQPQALANTV